MRTTLINASQAGEEGRDGQRGSLKLFFSYAPSAGATSAMLGEANELLSAGHDICVMETGAADTVPFDLDVLIARSPDLVVLEDLAAVNPEGSRNHMRFQDAEELMRAGVDVYGTLRLDSLQMERAELGNLGVKLPDGVVPDRILYDAQQLEFVDIDPAELQVRAAAQGRTLPAQPVLAQMRARALKVVSFYSSAMSGCGHDASSTGSEKVVAFVEASLPPEPVIREASRMSFMRRAEIEVVCVRRGQRPGSRRAELEDQEFDHLASRVRDLGFELVTLYGDDPAEAIADHLRTEGASDVVMRRRSLSALQRVMLPIQPPLADRIAQSIPGVQVHLVSQSSPASLTKLARKGLASFADFRLVDFILAAVLVFCGVFLARILAGYGVGDSATYLVFVVTVALIASATHSYLPTAVAIFACCMAQNYYFIWPYRRFTIDHQASLFVFIVMAIVLTIIAVIVARAARSAMRSHQREQRTQALFDLHRRLVHARGRTQVVSGALEAIEKIFGRSCAIYLRDPMGPDAGGMDRGVRSVRVVMGDLDESDFDMLSERAVVHWVFGNAEHAGGGTGTHSSSYIYYTPLMEGDVVRGVAAISVRKDLGIAEQAFFDQVANQVALALEHHDLAVSHGEDVRSMHISQVRNAFGIATLDSCAIQAGLIHDLVDIMDKQAGESEDYRRGLSRLVSEESSRTQLMTDRIEDILAHPAAHGGCDVVQAVEHAVEHVSAGLGKKVITLMPPQGHPFILGDSVLICAATRFILEAMSAYVGSGGSSVQIDIKVQGQQVTVSFSDDRPASVSAQKCAAFQLARTLDSGHDLTYLTDRATRIRELARDQETMVGETRQLVEALARAQGIPVEIAREVGDEGTLNRRRAVRFDRLEYGLYMAALMIQAHGGSIKQRYRLGGGVVLSYTLPLE